jgi:acyl-CoA synthetase (AMP-forming)/AMP-acid ligase II/enoyl-CoA hydratase/carnithine racemase
VNISMLLDMAADGFSDRVLVGGRETGLTAVGLHARAEGAASGLRSAGVTALVHLAVSGPALPVALFAAARAGIPLVPMNYRLGPAQLNRLLARHPGARCVADPAHADTVRQAGLACQSPAEFLASSQHGPGAAGTDAPETNAAAVVIYTSGTTAEPKGVLLRHQHLVSYVFGIAEFGSAGADEAALMSVPPYHISAIANVLTNVFTGRRLVMLESFAPQAWLDLVRAESITAALVVPTMLARIMDAPGLDLSVPSLRSLAYGGAQMPLRVIERALREWPHIGFVNAYGLTETSSTVSVLGPDDHRRALASADPAQRARLKSAGTAVPGVELEIRDKDGVQVAAGASGRIWVRGAQVSAEYTGQHTQMDAGGFFDTRDRGRLDADGYLFIEGREDDTIIRGAENVAPSEIEEVLLSHSDVTDVAVVGVPDEEWGQRIEAVVVLRPGSALVGEALREFAQARLRVSKTPERIEHWTEIPRTATGKLLRREIVKALASSGPVAAGQAGAGANWLGPAETVLVTEQHGAVRVLRLNLPAARNALSPELITEIGRALEAAEADPGVGCVVLTGTGDRAFCSGMDLRAFADGGGVSADADRAAFDRFLAGELAVPIIGAANAAAVAGGFELLLACDLVVASERAQFGLPEVQRGLFAAGGGMFIGTRIPLAIALELALTGDPIDAHRALSLGLVNRVVPASAVVPAALALAERITRNGPLAVRATKRLVRTASFDAAEARALQAVLRPRVFGSADAREGATAFLERRDPRWTGR